MIGDKHIFGGVGYEHVETRVPRVDEAGRLLEPIIGLDGEFYDIGQAFTRNPRDFGGPGAPARKILAPVDADEELVLLERLSGAGFRVRFEHLRTVTLDGAYVDADPEPAHVIRREAELLPGLGIGGRGGITMLRAERGIGTILTTGAFCSPDDNFSKRTGRIIALRRAVEAVGA